MIVLPGALTRLRTTTAPADLTFINDRTTTWLSDDVENDSDMSHVVGAVTDDKVGFAVMVTERAAGDRWCCLLFEGKVGWLPAEFMDGLSR